MALPPLPTVRELVRLYGLSARKQLSQNFIFDLNITDKIVRKMGDLRGHVVIEVGPGPGSLTRSLLRNRQCHVVVVEKDRRFFPALEYLRDAVGHHRMSIVEGDILEVDEGVLVREASEHIPELMTPYDSVSSKPFYLRGLLANQDDAAKRMENHPQNHNISSPERNYGDWCPTRVPVHLVGNLPFNISTVVLLKWLRQIATQAGAFSFGPARMSLMFQKEVADRICANRGSSNYSRLSVMSQMNCAVERSFDIPGRAFVPPPKVDGTLVTMIPQRKVPVSDRQFEVLEAVLREAFHHRRKTMRKSLSTLDEEVVNEVLERSGVDGGKRAQEVTMPEWIQFAKVYEEMGLIEAERSSKRLGKGNRMKTADEVVENPS